MSAPVASVTRSGTLLMAYVPDQEHPDVWRVLVHNGKPKACLGTWRADREEIARRLEQISDWDFPLGNQEDASG